MKQEAAERSEKQLEHFRETFDRLTAASHVQTEYFGEHKKIEGYYQSRMQGQMLGCDRLMKQENMFGRLQLGYNPNRERVFLFANLKTSRYDTVAIRYQKELKEYQQKTLLKGNNENRAYVSRYWEGASVLIEKRENKPWTRRSVASYLGRENMESLQKTLPFFVKEEEKKALEKRKSRKKELEKQIRQLRLEAGRQEAKEEREQYRERETELKELRREDTRGMYEENLLEAILIKKDASARTFLRKMNYAYDFQKKDIESYYRERKKTLGEVQAETEGDKEGPEDEDK